MKSCKTALFETLEPRLLLDAAVTLFETSPALFVANEGQWSDATVAYAILRDGANALFTDAGPVFQLFAENVYAEIAVTFDGANTSQAEGRGRSDAVFNYYSGPDASGWREGVSAWEAVVYADVYDGVDLMTYGRRDGLKYEFRIDPWTDYRQIQITYTGADALTLDDAGRLHVTTSVGEIVEDAPIIYQDIAGERVSVTGQFRKVDADTVTFVLTGAYDPRALLVIDPDLNWSSYLGGSNDDIGHDVAVDGGGNAIVTGQTDGGGFPTTGGFDTTYNTDTDAFVTKVSNAGALLWSSYLGGDGWEAGEGVDTDPSGNVIVVGKTLSSDFPIPGAFDTTYAGGYEGFVTKIAADGGSILWSSYLGGNAGDACNEVFVTSVGDMVVAGSTFSTDFDTTNGYDTDYNGSGDGFAARITSDGTYVWGTYLGGDAQDEAQGITLDPSGNVIVTGWTQSADFPHGDGGPETFIGSYDVFVTKLTNACGWVWGDIIGGAGHDEAHGVATDAAGNLFVTGQCQSGFPTTPGAYDTTYSGGDAFVLKLTSAGIVDWSTYLGGSAGETAYGLAVDGFGNVLVTGQTNSTDFDTTNGFDTTYNSDQDAFVTVFDNDGARLWSSYLGGSADDHGYGIDVNSAAAAVLVGKTESSNFPNDSGFDTALGGTWDAFVTSVEEYNNRTYDRHPLIFARDCYGDFLRRVIDEAGAAYFADQIENHGMSYGACAAFFLTTAEFEVYVAPIVRLYRAYLDRSPDDAGLDAWVNAVKAGVPMSLITYGFAHAPEFIAHHGDVYNTATNPEFITWLYNAVLKRTPAPAEVAAWQPALDNAWMTREEMMVAFSQSAEYIAAQNNTVHCTMAVLGLLDRPGSEVEIAWLVGAMGGGATLTEVCEALTATQEYEAHAAGEDVSLGGPVVRLYEGLLDRHPDYGGLVYWAKAYIEGVPLTGLAYGFITSAEVTGTYGDVYDTYTNTQYITWLYNRVLGRDPAPAEIDIWLPTLVNGWLTREAMALQFTESVEYQLATQDSVDVSGGFPMLIGRMPDAAERNYWETHLAGSTTTQDMVNSLVML